MARIRTLLVQTLSALTLLVAQYVGGANEIGSCELEQIKGGGEAGAGVCVPEYLCEKGYVKVYGEGLIDVRDTDYDVDLKLGNSGCPTGKVCCRSEGKRPVCDGTCLPRGRCGDSGLDAIVNDKRCPNNGVCCQHPKPSKRKAESVKCKGKCVPDKQCLLKALSKDIKHKDDGCPLHQVCCNEQELKCDGTCTAIDKCADCFNFATEVVLLLASSSCPGDEVCCKRLKSKKRFTRALELVTEQHTICNGTCTRKDQCLEEVSLDPKFSDHCCPVNSVCCKRVRGTPIVAARSVDTTCDGECVFQHQCPTFDKSALLDLRFSGEKCPRGMVCCREPPSEESCDGTCVFLDQCQDGFDAKSINLRFSDARCTGGKICCKNVKADAEIIVTPLPLEASCNGTCVPSEQCLDVKSLDLRFSEAICPLNTVCCQNPKQALVYSAQSSICDGECVARESCPSYDQSNSINLRLSDDKCPNGKVCCKNPPLSATCDGTCTFRHQCEIEQSSANLINLRFDAGGCGRGKVCCKKLKRTVITPTKSETSCNGTCVPEAQCSDVGTLDLRLSDESCPINTVCCQNQKVELVYSSQTTGTVCDGECVPTNSCPTFDQSSLLDVRISGEKCPIGQVCCKKPPVTAEKQGGICRDTCVPSSQCMDAESIDLRSSQGGDRSNCPFNTVCCKNVRKTSVDTGTECHGNCVLPQNCPTYDQSSLFDVRISGETCPFGQVCCKEPSCDGSCVSRDQCEVEQSSANSINLRFSGASCEGEKVCCKKLKRIAITTPIPSGFCRDTCVPKAQCLDVQSFNLRFGENSCPFNTVCCKNVKQTALPVETICDGDCVFPQNCPTNDQNSLLDLRFSGESCPNGKVCCKKSPTSESCDGTCVYPGQCEVLQSSANAINLRFSGSSCEGGKVCCKKLKRITTTTQIPSATCRDTCVPSAQCLDTQSFNLRFSQNTCPFNTVCCKNVKQTAQPVDTVCDGDCVFPQNCPTYDQSSFLDLRFSGETCPNGKVCCKKPSTESSCEGTCVFRDQCEVVFNVNLINLRSSVASCEGGKICCKKLKQVTESACNGTCVPKAQCLDVAGLDLKLSDSSCAKNLVCCRNPRKPSCEGQCTPFGQCQDPVPSFNLRNAENVCPFNQICCKNPKPVQDICQGTCVPTTQCAKAVVNQNDFNLRLQAELCPTDQVCCQELLKEEPCVCVPNNQCSNKAPFGASKCSANEVCCKNVKPVEPTCSGTCVLARECSKLSTTQGPVDLRLTNQLCPTGQVCCQETRKVKSEVGICADTCVPLQQCPELQTGAGGFNLRFLSGSCPGNQVCCKNPKFDQLCTETCVPHGQCSDSALGINLRLTENKCPSNQICCRNPKQLPLKAACPGQCVPFGRCPTKSGSGNNVDLRLSDTSCPNGQVCCEAPVKFPDLESSVPKPPKGTELTVPQPSATSQCIFGSDPTFEQVSKPEIPWLVTVWSRQELLGEQRRQYECVGVLLTTNLVLTTADCVKEANLDKLYVRVGDFNLKPISKLSPRREYGVAEIDPHPDYDNTSGRANVAVLHLAKNVPKPSEVCLSQTPYVNAESVCFTLGWNKEDFSDDTASNAVPEKHFLSTTTGNNLDCNEGFVCFNGANGEQQCADKFQGSPVLCFAAGTRSWQLTGLTAKENAKCDDLSVPRSFVAVGSYEMWIREQISPSFKQTKPVTNAPFYLPPL